jgi:CrcB protein
MLYVMIGTAGAVGALLRYAFGILIPSTYFIGFPVSTLVINISGSFGLSWFFAWLATHTFPNWTKTAIATGFIGSFTTFSTFNLELIQLWEKEQFFFALLYLISSTVGGYFFGLWGYELAKREGNVK